MSKEIPAELPKFKWKIIDERRAEDEHIELIEIDENTTLLKLNLCDKPKWLDVAQWIEYIQKSGIVYLDKMKR